MPHNPQTDLHILDGNAGERMAVDGESEPSETPGAGWSNHIAPPTTTTARGTRRSARVSIGTTTAPSYDDPTLQPEGAGGNEEEEDTPPPVIE